MPTVDANFVRQVMEMDVSLREARAEINALRAENVRHWRATMSDIVERLRENNPGMPTRDRYEAADTIEALRADNERLKEGQKKLEEQFHKVACEEADAKKKIERLQGAAMGESDE